MDLVNIKWLDGFKSTSNLSMSELGKEKKRKKKKKNTPIISLFAPTK